MQYYDYIIIILEVLVCTLLLILSSMVCSALLVRYGTTEMTAVTNIIVPIFMLPVRCLFSGCTPAKHTIPKLFLLTVVQPWQLPVSVG